MARGPSRAIARALLAAAVGAVWLRERPGLVGLRHVRGELIEESALVEALRFLENLRRWHEGGRIAWKGVGDANIITSRISHLDFGLVHYNLKQPGLGAHADQLVAYVANGVADEIAGGGPP